MQNLNLFMKIIKYYGQIMKNLLHTRELFYNDKLYDSNILQFYFYKMFKYIKAPLSYLIMLNNKKPFWKKEHRTFDLIEPSQELCVINI
jgi:hypothetical protein